MKTHSAISRAADLDLMELYNRLQDKGDASQLAIEAMLPRYKNLAPLDKKVVHQRIKVVLFLNRLLYVPPITSPPNIFVSIYIELNLARVVCVMCCV